MSAATIRNWNASRFIVILLPILVVLATIFAVVAAAEALEERSAAADVTDLRIAVLSVVEVNQDVRPDAATSKRLTDDIATLSANVDNALHAVDPESHSFVRAELAKLRSHAQKISDGRMSSAMAHGVAEHRELEQILRAASIQAGEDADRSERTARFTSIAAFGLGVLLAMSMLQSRAKRTYKAAQNDAFHAAALRLGALLNMSSEATAIVLDDGTFSFKSGGFAELFAPRDVTDLATLSEQIVESNGESLESLILRPGGKETRFEVATVTPSVAAARREFTMRTTDLRSDPVVNGHLITIRETTVDNQARRELEALTVTDQLTGLPNRRALMKSLISPDSEAVGLAMLDLDDFKRTNDTHGHDAGDQLLRIVADRFKRCCGEKQTLFRLGGDEFAILAESGGMTELNALGKRVVESLDEPVALVAGFEETHVSCGLAIWDGIGKRTSLLRRSDIALYAAKSNGGRGAVALSPELAARSTRQRSLSHLLHGADLNDEFNLVFQPVVKSTSGDVAFVEALIRWESPQLGPISPDEFISLAERSGRIVEVGLWVIRTALRELAAWRDAGLDHSIAMSVNVSPRQLKESSFVDHVLHLLHQFGVQPRDLIIEVTESALVSPGDGIVTRLNQLRIAGCRIACDDFGSGYSNLGQLMTLPLDIVKIDRELLLHLSEIRAVEGGDDHASHDVLNAVARIARGMDATTVAEGVETVAQQASVRASDVDFMQGYLFSRPVAGDELVHAVMSSEPVLTGSAALD